MTNEEAREILEKLIPQPQRGDGKSITHLMITEALTMAIKALEATEQVHTSHHGVQMFPKGVFEAIYKDNEESEDEE